MFVQMAFDDLGTELSKDKHSSDRIWYNVHGVVTAAANIAKVLSRKELAGSMKISADSELMNKGVRHALEHYDERFEEWTRNNPDRACSSFTIIDAPEFPQLPTQWLATLHVPSLTVGFLDQSVKLSAIRREVAELLPRVQANLKVLMVSTAKPKEWTMHQCEFKQDSPR